MIDFDKIHITNVLERLNIKKGKNSPNYHCPAHKDDKPSLSISNDGMFNCFSCGASGKNLALIQLAKSCNTADAIDWFESEFGDKKKKIEKIQLRRIGANIDKDKRFFYKTLTDCKIRNVNDVDIINCRTDLNKVFTIDGFQRANVKICEQPYAIAFKKVEFWHNTQGDKGVLVVEGATDFLTLCSNKDVTASYKIYSQTNKTQKFKLPKFDLKYFVILDPDATPENFLNCLQMTEKELREIKFYFVYLSKFNVKDISDYFANGNELHHLENLFAVTDEYDINKYFTINPTLPFCFWNKSGEINVYEFWRTMRSEGFFYGYYGADQSNRSLYRVENNIVYTFEEEQLQNYVYNNMLDRLPEKLNDKLSVRDLREAIMRIGGSLYEQKKYNTLPFKQLIFNKDNKDSAYFYFKNQAIRITKDNIESVDYTELKYPVLSTHIKDHEVNVIETDFFEDFSFYQFLKNVCRPSQGTAPEIERFNALKSSIGYLCHKYLSPIEQKAVIFSESNLTDKPKGRTGKGLISEAISKLVKVSHNDGKNFNQNSQFSMQNYQIGDNVILFSDVLKNFDFERLFSLITDGFEFEKKGMSRVRVSVIDSPKFMISTNFAIRTENSSSYKARIREMELYCYYNADFTPSQDFAEWFFVDWDSEKWDLFYCMMFSFVQYFLNNGLTKYVSETVEARKLLQSGGDELIDYISSLEIDRFYDVPELYKNFITFAGHSERDFSKKRFATSLNLYCEQRGYKVERKVSKNPMNSSATRYLKLIKA